MRSGRRIATIGGAAALLAVGTAACGSQAGGPAGGGSPSGGKTSASTGTVTTVQAVQTASAASTKQKSAAFQLTETIAGTSGTGRETIHGTGAADFATRAYRLSVTASGGTPVTVLATHGVEYVKVTPAERAQVPGDKPWLSINLNRVSQAKFGASYSQLSTVSGTSPAQALSWLAVVSGGVTRIGSATIDGVRATGYQARENLTRVADRVRARAGAKAAAAIRQDITALGTSTVPVRVWVDSRHLVRRLSYHVARESVTITLSRYGAPVNVTPPPSSQVTDITSRLLNQAG